MNVSRRRVRVAVNDRPLQVWEGTSVLERASRVVPEFLADATAGRSTVVDAAGRALDLDHEPTDGDVVFVVPVKHQGTKPI